jgi:hypothetical protein
MGPPRAAGEAQFLRDRHEVLQLMEFHPVIITVSTSSYLHN